MPSFLRFTSADPIVDIAVDNDRCILYTLSENSAIEVYDLGNEGDGMHRVIAKSDITSEAQKRSPRGHHLDKKMFDIVSIFPVEGSESGPVHLVAVTKAGMRIYMTTFTKQQLYALKGRKKVLFH